MFLNSSRRFGFSSRSLSFSGTAQEATCIHKEKRPIHEARTGIPAAPDLPPAPPSWAVPANENFTRPRLLVEKPKRREPFQNMIQSESKFIHFNNSIVLHSAKYSVAHIQADKQNQVTCRLLYIHRSVLHYIINIQQFSQIIYESHTLVFYCLKATIDFSQIYSI